MPDCSQLTVSLTNCSSSPCHLRRPSCGVGSQLRTSIIKDSEEDFIRGRTSVSVGSQQSAPRDDFQRVVNEAVNKDNEAFEDSN
ncbi:hypothetical protein JTE90_026986 [Oedothorax gibbosus]|uniref:Uncharacterized protein n=1 Tax=Oedothorax gibbosus TaxID=931172 RepID=A0AAV6TT66_9ARAC|nr:hypothetical protein JTE90_026986 [Oedothorax gibbosus]